jgi:hypothetical protein
MKCLADKASVGGALLAVGGSGIIAVVGAPTMVLSLAGVASAIGALGGLVTALKDLHGCYNQHDQFEDARRVESKLQVVESEIAQLKIRLGRT